LQGDSGRKKTDCKGKIGMMEADKIIVYVDKNIIKIYAGRFGMIEKAKTVTVNEDLFVHLNELLYILGWKQTEKDDLMKIITYERKPK
jgi:hypothetical protein